MEVLTATSLIFGLKVREAAEPKDQLVSMERAITGRTNTLYGFGKLSFCPIAVNAEICRNPILIITEKNLFCASKLRGWFLGVIR